MMTVSLSSGRDLFMTPGPSVMPDRVLNAMHQAAPNIYEGELIDTTDSILSDLAAFAGTQGHTALYICNEQGVGEAAISNRFEPGARVWVLNSGTFGSGWANLARGMGIAVLELDFGRHDACDAEQVREQLSPDKAQRVKAEW